MTPEKTKQLMQDKKSIIFLLAGFMKNPDLLINKEFQVTVDDFPEKFHKIVYSAMHNLYKSGIQELNPIEIDTYISAYDIQYRIFNDNNGLDILYRLEETPGIGNEKNMKHHYDRVKKFSFLRECAASGIDISDIMDFSIVDVKENEKQNMNFDSTSLKEMSKHVEGKFVSIKDKFMTDNANKGGHMGENIDDILSEKFAQPSFGYNLVSGYLTRAMRGALPKKVMLVSAPTGAGKSRITLANLLTMTVRKRYDKKTDTWIETGAKGKGLYVGTELEEDEVKIPALCFIADVEEDKIQENIVTEEEKARLRIASGILKETPLWYEELHEFDPEDIEYTIEKHIYKNEIDVLGYDYIHASDKMLAYYAKLKAGLQEHQMLLQLSTKLKSIANKHEIFIATATQVNENHKDQDNNMDASSIAGSKAIANKVDVAAIFLPLSNADDKLLETIFQSGNLNFGTQHPNMSFNLYKNRGNKWRVIRIWMQFNHGTLHCQDLFVTDYKGNLIPNIKPLHVMLEEVEEAGEDEIEFLQEKHDELPTAFDEVENEPNMIQF